MLFRHIYLSKSSLLYSLFTLLLLWVTSPVFGQLTKKKQLELADYSLWGRLEMNKVSPNEKWISYQMVYENGSDTLFVKNVKTDKTFSFPSASNSLFTKNNLLLYKVKSSLHVLELEREKSEAFQHVGEFVYAYPSNLLILSSLDKGRNQLIVKTPLGKILREIPDVVNFSLSPDGLKLVYTSILDGENSLFTIDLSKPEISNFIAKTVNYHYDNFKWQKDGKAVVFYGKTKESIKSLFFYSYEKASLFELDGVNNEKFPKGFSIVHFANSIVISDDLQKVFFTIKPDKKLQTGIKNSPVEVWNANDKYVYPQEQHYGRFEETPKIALWKPDVNTFTQITTAEFPALMLLRNYDFGLLSNQKTYEPQYEPNAPRDYFILNLKTGKKELLFTKQSSDYGSMFSSPNGRYISYFMEKNWWVYDIELNKNINLTAKNSVNFDGKMSFFSPDEPIGNPGWSKEGSEILLYDEFDIWAFKLDGSSSRRLTRGREAKVSYRIDDQALGKNRAMLYDSPLNFEYDLDRVLYLKAMGDDGQRGYFTWKVKSGEKKIIYGNAAFEKLIYNPEKNTFFCVEQRFDLSPRIISNVIGKTETIYQSNRQQDHYYWGRNELISFNNSNGQPLKGILYYPANYNPQKKYPMVVRIYERQSKGLHNFIIPTYYNEAGFNPTVFTLNGYFVFLPDITHENENVGPSTLDCVVAGTKKVISLGLVNPEKIALTGHSFGGYETAFVINHTQIFTTAIASGGIVDLTRRFLTYGKNMRKPEMWRFSSGGWRMGEKTPFANRTDFDRNSPLESILNLQIPLLMWVGKEDTQVDPLQSLSYYLALRRLGKKSIFLQYPGEDHTILDPTKQIDLTTRTLTWLDYFLKDDKSAEWITKGTMEKQID